MAMLSSDAEGVYVIAATPFTENGSVDHASMLSALVNDLNAVAA